MDSETIKTFPPEESDSAREEGVPKLFSGDLEKDTKNMTSLSPKEPKRKKRKSKSSEGTTGTDEGEPPKRPNYFVAFQVYDKEIHDNAAKVQEEILSKKESIKRAFISLPTLHITFAIMHLHDDQDVAKASLALESSYEKLRDTIFNEPLPVKFAGLGNFTNNILFAKVCGEETIQKLRVIAETVNKCMEENGVSLANETDFMPHMTLAKLSKAPELRRKKIYKIDKKWYEESKDLEFGTQVVKSLQLASMLDKKDETGYYHCKKVVNVNNPAVEPNNDLLKNIESKKDVIKRRFSTATSEALESNARSAEDAANASTASDSHFQSSEAANTSGTVLDSDFKSAGDSSIYTPTTNAVLISNNNFQSFEEPSIFPATNTCLASTSDGAGDMSSIFTSLPPPNENPSTGDFYSFDDEPSIFSDANTCLPPTTDGAKDDVSSIFTSLPAPNENQTTGGFQSFDDEANIFSDTNTCLASSTTDSTGDKSSIPVFTSLPASNENQLTGDAASTLPCSSAEDATLAYVQQNLIETSATESECNFKEVKAAVMNVDVAIDKLIADEDMVQPTENPIQHQSAAVAAATSSFSSGFVNTSQEKERLIPGNRAMSSDEKRCCCCNVL